jgi:hypothetical protein
MSPDAFRKQLTEVALTQLLAQMDCNDGGAPSDAWMENYQVRTAMGQNSVAMHTRIIDELRDMLGIES